MRTTTINDMFNGEVTDLTGGIASSQNALEFAYEQYGKLVLDKQKDGKTIDTVYILNSGENSKVAFHVTPNTSFHLASTGEAKPSYFAPAEYHSEEVFGDFLKGEDFLVAIDFKGNIAMFKTSNHDNYPKFDYFEESKGRLMSLAERIKLRNFSGSNVSLHNAFYQEDPLSAIYPNGLPE